MEKGGMMQLNTNLDTDKKICLSFIPNEDENNIYTRNSKHFHENFTSTTNR